jgi:hypothetical protein
MKPRIQHPAMTLPGAMEALQGLTATTKGVGLPETTLYLVTLRAIATLTRQPDRGLAAESCSTVSATSSTTHWFASTPGSPGSATQDRNIPGKRW